MRQVERGETPSSKIKPFLKLFSILVLAAVAALILYVPSGCGDTYMGQEDPEYWGERKEYDPQFYTDQPPSQSGEEETAQEEAPATELVFDNGNEMAVFNSPSAPTVFTLPEERHIYLIVDYHWNDGAGMAPGTIAFQDTSSGAMYGPWQATGTPGQGGVPDAYWNAYPDIDLPAGTYEVIDSDPGTWSQNEDSGGCGIVRIHAVVD